MSRRHKNPYEANENRKTKHRPYGTKAATWSSTDKDVVWYMHKKSARQKGKKEIDDQTKDIINQWEDEERSLSEPELGIWPHDPTEYIRKHQGSFVSSSYIGNWIS